MAVKWAAFALVFLFHSLCFAQNEKCLLAYEKLGSNYDSYLREAQFALHSPQAERVELHVYASPQNAEPVGIFVMDKHPDAPSIWNTNIHANALKEMGLMDWNADGIQLDRPLYYGFRLWGSNWKYHPDWRPGTEIGFIADVDHLGNRFNPNKLVYDPRAKELSHDPVTPQMQDDSVYVSGPFHRFKDSGPVAPKGIVLNPNPKPENTSPITRPLKDDVIYEVHVRGFTKNDPSIPAEEQGTYKGAARKAKYLKELGVTAVEFLPVHEFQNENNSEHSTKGNNYWGYMTNGFFAPDRRYATKENQEKHGGVTQEFKEMVEAFHKEGIKVILDVVYNHTGEEGAGEEGGRASKILSMRGIDNPGYYQLAGDRRYYKDNTGCGANVNCANPYTRDFILDSLKYFKNELGVDGFRFDLASVLGNTQYEGNGFHFDKFPGDNPLNRALKELPARAYTGGQGVDLIAEPWAIGDNSYQVGGFPSHPETDRAWFEWNGPYRDTMRKSQNSLGSSAPTPGEVAKRIAGSSDLFGDRKPGHSVNFIAAHDGFTLADIYRYNEKQNNQQAPFGPSDGGEDHNNSWNQQNPGDNWETMLAKQRQANRNGFALPLLSFGVPMFNGGDEFQRTQRGNNNMWNVDSLGSWIDWSQKTDNKVFHEFAKRLIHFRQANKAYHREHHFQGQEKDNGLRDISWLKADGKSAEYRDLDGHEKNYMDNPKNTFIAYRLNGHDQPGEANSIYVAYNYGSNGKTIQLPPSSPGKQWHWVGDTSSYYENNGNIVEQGKEIPISQLIPNGSTQYLLDGRAITIFIEK